MTKSAALKNVFDVSKKNSYCVIFHLTVISNSRMIIAIFDK